MSDQLYDQATTPALPGSDYTFDRYQEQTRSTAIYPGALTGSLEELTYLGLGLGEAGEIQGKLKKVLRDQGGVLSGEARFELIKELGDLQWYVARLADALGAPLGKVAEKNISKLLSRQDRGVLGGNGDNR